MVSGMAWGQKLIFDVSVVLDKLPLESQQKLVTFQSTLADHLNNFEWNKNEYQYPLKCSAQIFFERALTISYEDRYQARFLISNNEDFQQFDKKWEFRYTSGEHLNHRGPFHTLTGLVDFYVYLLLGNEYDKWKLLGGTRYYEKAREIVNSSRFEQLYLGWDQRKKLLDEILSPDNEAFRKMRVYYYSGMYYFRENDLETARDYLLTTLSQLEDIPRIKTERFFELNYLNLAQALLFLESRENYRKLIKFDPPHKSTYQEFMNKIPIPDTK